MLLASDVKLDPNLGSTFSNIGGKAKQQIGANYAGIKGQLASDARGPFAGGAASVGDGSYGGTRLATRQGFDNANVDDALSAALGGTSYKDALSQREFSQNTQLANEAAKLNKPNLLQQIFQGIGSVGKPVAAYAGANGGFSPKIAPPAPQAMNYWASGYGDPGGYDNGF